MSAETRFETLTQFSLRFTRDALFLARILTEAYTERDYEELGMETWAEYLDSAGVGKSQDSKMRKAYSVFGGVNLDAYPEATLERLYLAARLVERDSLSKEEGLALAASTPSHSLVAMLKGEPADPKPTHLCPECGTEHILGRSQ